MAENVTKNWNSPAFFLAPLGLSFFAIAANCAHSGLESRPKNENESSRFVDLGDE